MKSLLNKKAVKEFSLECCKFRYHKFTRVSSDFLIGIENAVKEAVRRRVEGHPSVGKTLMAIVVFLLIGSQAFASTASWYNSTSVKREGTCHAEKCFTASGKEIHELEKSGVLFAASNDYKLGTTLRVTNKRNGKSVVVRVWDRGGFGKYGRKIDLGRLAFSRIADPKLGLVDVGIEKIS